MLPDYHYPIDTEPIISWKESPHPGLPAVQKIEQAATDLRQEEKIDIPILMTSVPAFSDNQKLNVFPARMRWKRAAADSNMLSDVTAGAVSVVTVFFNTENQILWVKQAVDDQFAWLLSTSVYLTNENIRGAAIAKNRQVLGVSPQSYKMNPAAVVFAQKEADVFILFLAELEPSAILRPGKGIEDLLWTDFFSPPTQAHSATARIKSTVLEVQRRAGKL